MSIGSTSSPRSTGFLYNVTDEQIEAALVKGAYVTPEEIQNAETYAKTHHASLTEYLLNEELINRQLIGQAVAEASGVPYFDLGTNMPETALIQLIPENIAKSMRAICVTSNEATMLVATDQLQIEQVSKELAPVFPGKTITVVLSLSDDVEVALRVYRKKLATRFGDILKGQTRVAPQLLSQILEDALALRASDIHIEPQLDSLLIRFRVDGILEEAGVIPKQFEENLLNRLKLEANLRTDEHQKSQDGALHFEGQNGVADIRVSILPTLSGEKAVLRILSSYLRSLSLADLGLSEQQQARIIDVVTRPYGMILTVGPTGSGKTTTLYGVLKYLNDTSVNITTIEDPVEYRIPRVNQVQVNEIGGMTFARGLRSIVRQDPDVILVGEIRDLETAEVAVNASLTGHLLLSTFHANDASTVIPRLLDMKVEPFMLASTLMMVIAQRLIRTICSVCKISEEWDSTVLSKKYPNLTSYFPAGTIRLYVGKGCEGCHGTGFKGQIGIFEFVEISAGIQSLIMENPSADRIAMLTKSEGSESFFEDGLRKVFAGRTTLDELLRVALPPEMAKDS